MPRKLKKQSIAKRLNQAWLRYEYKHTSIALAAIALFLLLLDTAVATALFSFVENLGYVGSFITGLLSVSFFTAVPAVALLVDLANEQSPVVLALCAGIGSVIGDWLILLFFEERIATELAPIFKKTGLTSLFRAMRRFKATSWLFFAGGALVLSTPIPDEIGIAMLGISHFSKITLLTVAFICNFTGILLLALAVRAIT